MLSAHKIEKFSKEFETKTPQEIIEWAVDRYSPYIAMSSSFQTQSMPLLHMVSQINRNLLIYFIDTGYHFWETSIFREQLASDWHLNVLDLYRDSRWDVTYIGMQILVEGLALAAEGWRRCCSASAARDTGWARSPTASCFR